MTIELNHTIVRAHDKRAAAQFLAGILGLTAGPAFGPFVPVELDNGVSLDNLDATGFQPQHYAFLVPDDVFDAAFAKVRAAGLEFFADPGHERPGEINHRWDGRGFYFLDPGGHHLELLTRAPQAGQ
jgi:catechol 2,3-dioxygenase-like lactoylglutathione lyase family enzyme